MPKKGKHGKFCLDVSSLPIAEQITFAKMLKNSVDSFNKTLGEDSND